jgi:hypothetical protein
MHQLKLEKKNSKKIKIKEKLTTGTIIGKVELYDVKKYESLKEIQKDKINIFLQKIFKKNIWIYFKKFQTT